jgi:hypothetical protein
MADKVSSMYPDGAFIPFSESRPPSGKTLVFSSSLYDAVVGMGGVLSYLKEQGEKIVVIIFAGKNEANTKLDKNEAIYSRIGATTYYLHSSAGIDRLDENFLKEIANVVVAEAPENIYIPSPFEYRQEHRSFAVAVDQAIQLSGVTTNLYSYEISRQCEANLLCDITQYVESKRALAECEKEISDLDLRVENAIAINVTRGFTLSNHVTHAEAFFKWGNTLSLREQSVKRTQNYFYNSLPCESPVISLIIRTKDRPEHLHRALSSLEAIPYRSKLEVIVVNDGGVSVEAVVTKFSQSFHDLLHIELVNSQGRSSAANVGLINCSGAFINFLDDDDTVDQNHIEVFLNTWRRDSSVEVFYRGVRVLDDQGKELRTYNQPFNRFRLMNGNFIPIHAVTFSRRFVDMGCRFDESLDNMEDWDFWIQLSRLAFFHHFPEVTATYHLTGDSAASSKRSKILKSDARNHINRVRDKWFALSTSIEVTRAHET